MTLEIQPVPVRKELKFPIMLKQMTEQETREYHLKKIYQMSLKWAEQDRRKRKTGD